VGILFGDTSADQDATDVALGGRAPMGDVLIDIQRALLLSEARRLAVLDVAVDGVITVNSEGLVDGFNRSAETIFGWSAAEIVGRPYKLLLPAASLAMLHEETHGGELPILDPIETTATHKSGRTLQLQATIGSAQAGNERFFTAIVRDLSERKAMDNRLEFMSLHDELTGLANRRLLLDHIDHAIAQARVSGHRVALMYLDFDGFELVNDSLGHDAGDELLALAASRIGSVIRDSDTLARVEADEFVVLCDRLAGLEPLAEIRERIALTLDAPLVCRGREVYLSASIGVAVWDGGDQGSLDLLRSADTAMYRAKGRGRAGFQVFEEEMLEAAKARLDLESALRRALERNELRCFYQPIVLLATGELLRFEALVRWDRAELGLVLPVAFIGVAEATGLIVRLGEAVLRQATRDCAAWQKIAPGVGVAVNVSCRQLEGEGLIAMIESALAESGLPPDLLSLELTESVLFHETESNLALLARLRSLGVRIALDDFGTGFSSLTYLRRMHVDTLKIDKDFVDSVGTTSEDTTLLRTIIGLGAAYELDVVAEGIDSATKLRVLQDLGCRYGQGYLFSQAVSIADVREALGHSSPFSTLDAHVG
jgi:diguanylate cyclase (GGDEF)-like protein/PAS domain S-box-containing protein